MNGTSWPVTRTSGDYMPAVLLMPGQAPRRCNVLAVRLDSVEQARRKLAEGSPAVVAAGDAERVKEGVGSGESN